MSFCYHRDVKGFKECVRCGLQRESLRPENVGEPEIAPKYIEFTVDGTARQLEWQDLRVYGLTVLQIQKLAHFYLDRTDDRDFKKL